MPRFSANISMLFTELPFVDRFAAARQAGFEAVEFWFPYDHDKRELKRIVQGEGLVLAGMNTAPGDPALGEFGLATCPGGEAAFEASLEQALDYAAELEARCLHVLAGSVTAAGFDACERTYLRNLTHAARRAEDMPVTLLIEPLNTKSRPGYLLSRSDQAADILRQLGADNVKLMFDIFHVQIMEGDIVGRLRRHWPLIGHIQIAGVPARDEPDRGELAYGDILSEIDALGWAGFVGCEYQPSAGTLAGLGWRERLRG